MLPCNKESLVDIDMLLGVPNHLQPAVSKDKKKGDSCSLNIFIPITIELVNIWSIFR